MGDRPVDHFEVGLDRIRARAGAKWTRYGDDVLASWVADMDFDPPEAVTDAIGSILDRGDLGYLFETEQLRAAYADWQAAHHGWRPDTERVRIFTSALHAMETVLWFTTEPGDGVVVFTPIYYPFLDAIADSGRRRVDVPLDPNGWRIDPERLDAAIDPSTRVVLFCQPHNPTGRVFDDDEVAAVAVVADRHDLLVVSDEIWCDLTFDRPHRPLATVDDRFAGRLVTLGSASKSFNLAGLRCGLAHIDHPPLDEVFATMPGHLLGAPSSLGVAGTLAAWRDGHAWLERARGELRRRRDRLVERVGALGGVSMASPEATYLAWLDFRASGLGDNPSYDLLKRGGVALSEGPKFGPQGAGFARLNFATTEPILDEIVDRIASVL